MIVSRRPLRFLFASGIILAGCNGLLDVKDIYLDPVAETPPGLDGSVETSTTPDGSGGDGGTEASACNANLQIDAKNCGRCNHDCLGGLCTTGKCDPFTLAAGLGSPSGIAVGPTDVYFTTYGTGTVQSVKKTGGLVATLAPAETRARGVAVLGNTLYWANGDYSFDDAGSNGGIWQCTLPACSAKKLFAIGGYDTAYPVVRGGFVYFGAGEDQTVNRVPAAGGANSIITTTNSPFGIAADDVHVYFTSGQTNVFRAPLDGGTAEAVGALNSSQIGFVAVDDLRMYWAYTDVDGIGQVLSVAKAAPGGGTTSYGTATDNVRPVGVAVDAENLYWSTSGTGPANAPVGDGKIFSCKKEGCGGAPPVVLATGNVFAGQMTVDDVAIYWNEFGSLNGTDGKVRKVAKP